jgi:dihydrofolate synthase / folylpolyglutamate synthase
VPASALDYLFSLEQFGIKYDLDNIRALMAALDHPHLAYRTVHIAGTNGKGSVTAMVDAMLRAAGHRTGRYTSPHLIAVNERFVISGEPVTTERLESAAAVIRRTVDDLVTRGLLRGQPTFFEGTTALALDLFRSAGVEVGVCEVGLGGRLDATNILQPCVTAITSIGFDHQRFLGTTIPEIAREKAGIIKPGIPVVLGRLPAEAVEAIVPVARERQAPVVVAQQQCVTEDHGADADGRGRMTLRTAARDYGRVTLALAGQHQVGNAQVAVCIAETLDAAGLVVPSDAVRQGLAETRWPGRLERRRLTDGRDLLLDAAHNPEGAAALAAYLAAESEPRALVFAAMDDKEFGPMLSLLTPHARALVLTRALTPRSADPAVLSAAVAAMTVRCPVHVEPDLSAALALAWRLTPRIVVAGSIFLLGDVMKQLGQP